MAFGPGPGESYTPKIGKFWTYANPLEVTMLSVGAPPATPLDPLDPARDQHEFSRSFYSDDRMAWRTETGGNGETKLVQEEFQFVVSHFRRHESGTYWSRYNRYWFKYLIYGLGLPLHNNLGSPRDHGPTQIDIILTIGGGDYILPRFGFVEWGCRMAKAPRTWNYDQIGNDDEVDYQSIAKNIYSVKYVPKGGVCWAEQCPG